MYVCVCCFFFSVHGTCTANNTRVNIHCHTAVAKPHFLFSFIYTIFFIPCFVLLTVISRMIRIHRTPNMKKKNKFIYCGQCALHARNTSAHTHTHSKYNHKTLFVRNWFRWVGGSHSAHAAILLHCMHAALWSISAFGKISFFFHFASISSNERQRSLWLNHTWQRTLKSFCAQLTKLFCQLQLYFSQQLLYRHIHSALMDMCIGRKKI